MPTYEYRCVSCGHQFEAIHKMADDPLKTCPECNRDELERLVSAAGFQLKGTGWYVTDFKSKSDAKAKTTEQPATKQEKSKEVKSDPGSKDK